MSKENRQDVLQVATTARSGKTKAGVLVGCAYLTVTKAFNEPSMCIAVEVTHNTGVGVFKLMHKRETALVNIEFTGKDGMHKFWSGTPAELEAVLFPELPITQPNPKPEILLKDHEFIVDQLSNAYEHSESVEEFITHLHNQIRDIDDKPLPKEMLRTLVAKEGPNFLTDPAYEMNPDPYYIAH